MAWYNKWAVMVIAAAIGVGAYNWIRWCDVDATVVAYWVQAIGSISAIIGAFAIARWQANSTQKKINAERAASIAALWHIGYLLAKDATACLNTIVHKFNLINSANRPPIGTERLQEILQMLRVFSAKDLPSEIYVAIILMQREIAYTLTAVREQNEMSKISDVRLRNANTRALKVRKVRDNLESKWMRFAAEASNHHRKSHTSAAVTDL